MKETITITRTLEDLVNYVVFILQTNRKEANRIFQTMSVMLGDDNWERVVTEVKKVLPPEAFE